MGVMFRTRRCCVFPDLEKLKLLQAIGVEDVSSRQLAESLDIKASQLRHDFHYFGGFSRPGRPYQVDKLVEALEKIIGIAQPVPRPSSARGIWGRPWPITKTWNCRGFRCGASSM